jgi:hypothetical protein
MTRRRKPQRASEAQSTKDVSAISQTTGRLLSPFLETVLADLEAVIGRSANGPNPFNRRRNRRNRTQRQK